MMSAVDLAATIIDTDDPDLPNHTLCMRRVLQYCVEQLKELPTVQISSQVISYASSVAPRDIRRHALDIFVNISTGSALSIAEVDNWDDISPCDFKRLYQRANVPCKIKKATSFFEGASNLWTKSTPCSDDNDDHQRTQTTTIHHEWFLQALGTDAIVPVRRSHENVKGLDDQGRASECETLPMPLREWLDLLDTPLDAKVDRPQHHYYLKDWHLMKQLQDSDMSMDPSFLYTVPPHFAPDLLNDYLSFSDGDFKFVYWGPRESHTALHSDVMGSFSWSYNVCGTKEWTIYVPTLSDNGAEKSPTTTVTVTQAAGECMFVPAGWMHSVVNVDHAETLSINHNWITTANIDIVWDVMTMEMQAIDNELTKWNDASSSADAKENMLLGCVGLNVTAFVLMLMLGIGNVLRSDGCDSFDAHLDLLRLGEMLQRISSTEMADLCLEQRMEASLDSKDLTLLLLHVMSMMLERIGMP